MLAWKFAILTCFSASIYEFIKLPALKTSLLLAGSLWICVRLHTRSLLFGLAIYLLKLRFRLWMLPQKLSYLTCFAAVSTFYCKVCKFGLSKKAVRSEWYRRNLVQASQRSGYFTRWNSDLSHTLCYWLIACPCYANSALYQNKKFTLITAEWGFEKFG